MAATFAAMHHLLLVPRLRRSSSRIVLSHLFLLASLAACGDDSSAPDAGPADASAEDTGSAHDGGSPADAASPPRDSGGDAPGGDDAAVDAGVAPSGPTIGARPVSPSSPSATDLYASPDVPYGSSEDLAADGSRAAPLSLRRALERVEAGQTVWLRGGIYRFSLAGDDPYYPTAARSGTADARIVIEGFPGERAVLEGTPSDWNVGSFSTERRSFRVQGRFVTLRNFEVRRNAAFGVYIEGDDVIVEGLTVHDNLQTGIANHGERAIIRDNVVYGNSDYGYSNGIYDNGNNADGISSVLATDGTVIEHNTVYGNSDDGIDLFYGRSITVRRNRVYWNGRRPDGSMYTESDFRGNGQGIKMGGTGSQGNLAEHNLAFENLRHGFDISERDNLDCLMRFNTAWRNGGKGFYDLDGIGNLVQSNIASENSEGPSNGTDDEDDNSWQRSGTVAFVSTDPSSDELLRPTPGGGFDDIGAYAEPR